MASSRRKHGGVKRDTYKAKKMGKGYSTVRKQPQGSRPVLRLTEPEGADSSASGKHGKGAGA